jgi:hypothetical protein
LILGLINILKNKNHQFQVWVKFYWLTILSVIGIMFIRLYGSSFMMMGLVLILISWGMHPKVQKKNHN